MSKVSHKGPKDRTQSHRFHGPKNSRTPDRKPVLPPRQRDAFTEGANARMRGKPPTCNPFRTRALRAEFAAGYLVAEKEGAGD